MSPILSPVNQDPSLQERKGFPRSPVELKEGEQFSNHHLNYCVDEAGGWGRGRKKGLGNSLSTTLLGVLLSRLGQKQ